MKKNLYLMRHGETLFNARKKIQGWCDSPRTDKGIMQAKAARALIKDIPFDHYYSLTAERCCDTLEIVTDNQVEYKRLKQLKERNFGYDGLFPHYGGEYFSDVVSRMTSTIKEIMDKDDHQNVLALSHGGACYAFLCSVTNPGVVQKSGGFTNCCILHFVYEDGKFSFVEVLRPEF